jgi:RNA polymerase sigma-70 factor (ECF subfamily)
MAQDFSAEDNYIVSEVLAGNKELFRMLVHRYQKMIYGMGMSFFHAAEDAEDFTQDVFLKAFRYLGSFQNRSRFSTWLYKISYNTAVTKFGAGKNYISLSELGFDNSGGKPAEELLPSAYRTPEEELVRNVVKSVITKELDALPAKYRFCIDLYFFYDRSYKEIEHITGFTENTVKSHIFRAKKLLKARLLSADISVG